MPVEQPHVAVQTAEPGLRIGFPGSLREARVFHQARVCAGTGPDCDIVLDGGAPDAPSPRLELLYRHRAWQLRVADGGAPVYVNARPVRELALLRLGDVISVADQRLLLLPVSDHLDDPDPLATLPQASPAPLCGLRCVAGPWSGRLIATCPYMQIDEHQLPGVEGCLRLQRAETGLHFDLLDGRGSVPACNGLPALRGVMHAGDQLTWGAHRFVLDAGPASARTLLEGGTEVVQPVPAETADTRPWRELAGLLGVAVLLALVIAALLL